MSETKEQLLEQANAVREKLDKIEEREWRERNAGLVGKCFKYHNSNGGDTRWWYYAKVHAARSNYDCRAFTFQTDNRGQHEIEPNNRMSPSFIGNGSWKPISAAEFNREWKKLQRKIAGYKP